MPLRVCCFDLEVVTQDAHVERLMAEPFPADTWKPLGNASKPETIQRQKEEAAAAWDTTRTERIDALCLSPRTGRIVCAAAAFDIASHEPFLAAEEIAERHLLNCVWASLANAQLVVSFCGLTFDMMYLVIRSAILGVRPTRPIQPLLKRYSVQPHFDCYAVLGNWDRFAGGTKDQWSAAFGLPAQAATGADVGALHRAGDYAAIAAHCMDDVRQTLSLFTRLRPYYLPDA